MLVAVQVLTGAFTTGVTTTGLWAGRFTGVVRAPLTGMVLITEMTTAFNLLLPMLAACFATMLLPTLMRDKPIYESLRERLLKR